MGYFLLLLLALVLALFGARLLLYANPATLASAIRYVGAGALGLIALALFATGRWAFALPAGMFALSLLGRQIGLKRPAGRFGWGGGSPSSGQASTVRSALVEMTLDHDSGAMRGIILQGALAGSDLDDLEIEDVIGLYAAADDQSAALLEAYLDRRSPGWREDAQTDTGRGERQSGPVDGPMTQEEAYEILGLAPGAGISEINSAHRALMKRFHPDRGGTSYLAAKINEAKDTLLKTHEN
jgi:hypothetical protein